MLSEISQTEKNEYYMISLICGISKTNKQKNKINEQTKPNKNKHIDIEKRVVVTRGEGVGENETGKGDQQYSNGWTLNFWWLVCCRVHRSRNLMLYT